jgi:hypothetical protein
MLKKINGKPLVGNMGHMCEIYFTVLGNFQQKNQGGAKI